jgi:catechol 2,3-dioxygenase-like lactoylglutathione lyase family enzyme
VAAAALMQLLDHLSITVRDLGLARPFYLAIMAALGARVAHDRADAVGFGERNRPHDDVHTYLSVYQSAAAGPDPRRHVCLRAASEAEVDAFHAAGLGAGGSSDGAPGLRAYHPQYYAAFLKDPEGNKIEAVFHHAGARPGA